MFYGHYNTEGEYIGFYTDSVHDSIPTPNVKLSKYEWQEAIQGNYKVINKRHTKTREPGPDLENSLRIVREERNHLLLNSDWSQFADSPLSDIKKKEWSTYRQKLRDMMQDCDIHSIIYPTKPT